MDYLVSVIVPAYNIDTYISECLDSLLSQTYKNIEIIIVDDGSTDRTGKIIDDYANKYSNISCFHQKNQGQAVARNNAYKYVNGEFLTYVDGDDICHSDMISHLVAIQKITKADIVQAEFRKFYDISSIKKIYMTSIETQTDIKISNYTPQSALREFLYTRKFINSPWGKLIRSDIMSDLEFPTKRGYEDGALMYKVYGKASSLTYIPTVIYFYRQHKTSTMHVPFNIKKLDRLLNAEEMKQYITEKYPENLGALNTRYSMAMLQVLMWLPFNTSYKRVKKDTYRKLSTSRFFALKDSNTPFTLRMMLLFSYLGATTTMCLGRLYRLATRQ